MAAARSPRSSTTIQAGCLCCSVLLACAGARRGPDTGAEVVKTSAGKAAAKPGKARSLDDRIAVEGLERQLTAYVESIGAGFGPGYRMSGFVAAAAAGQALYARGFGYADLDTRQPHTLDTSFRIGAITQQFTATAILRLAQQGRLATSDRVGQHLKDYPSVGAGLRIEQLLSHTAGLPNYMGGLALSARRARPQSVAELLGHFAPLPLEFTPGSEFRYSDSNYAVLGAIVERVSGQTYANFMQAELFGPFGLSHTRLADTAAPNQARGYSASESGGLAPVQGFHPSILFAAAGLSSSASDLLLWHDALQNQEVLEPELERALFRPVLHQYAYGWFVRELHGVLVHRHAGSAEGFSSQFLRVPELDLAIVVLSNNSSVDSAPIADAALRMALGESVPPLPQASSMALDPSITERITGTYRLSDAAAAELARRKIAKRVVSAMRSVRIYEEQGKLYFKPRGQAAVPLLATGGGRFVVLGGKAKIEVPLDPAGSPATQLLLEQGLLRVEFTRRARVRGKADDPEPEAAP